MLLLLLLIALLAALGFAAMRLGAGPAFDERSARLRSGALV
jgi:hypothetical protein